MISKLLKFIYEFRECFQQPIAKSFAEYNRDAVILYHNAIKEEADEYKSARGRIETLDALGDLTYVIFGAVASTGIAPLEYKGRGPKANPGFKPTLYSIQPLLIQLSTPLPSYLGLFNTLTAAYYEMVNISKVQGVKLLPLVEEIHSSNMTKLWTAEEIQNAPPDVIIISIPSRSLFIVKRKKDGKVVKSPSYRPPDLSTF